MDKSEKPPSGKPGEGINSQSSLNTLRWIVAAIGVVGLVVSIILLTDFIEPLLNFMELIMKFLFG